MGFTIQDLLISSQEQYHMQLIAGNNGWANSISWLIMLEEFTVIKHFSGKELAVTRGVGFETTEKLQHLVEELVAHNAAGLIVNTGNYIEKIPQEIREYCDENDLPLITVPWEVILADMIKEISIQVFLQSTADEQITEAMIRAIEMPDNQEMYRKDLLPYFDVDGTFQVFLIRTADLDKMDTVERKKLSYRLQLFLENISHNGSFFYYDGSFVVVTNDVSEEDFNDIIQGMTKRAKRRMPEKEIYVGCGSVVYDISSLAISYARAKAAVAMAMVQEKTRVDFEEMGIFRLLYQVNDQALLEQMCLEKLEPIMEYDKKHDSNYLETLECYLKHSGSIQAVAEELYTHRNTVIYRMANIKKLLGSELATSEERISYHMAFYILKMKVLRIR